MKKYFLDPVNNNLIVADADTGQVSVIEAMKNVRVFVAGGSAYMTEGHEELDEHSSAPPPGKNRTSTGRGTRKCGNCGEVGHSKRTCPNGEGSL